jgi:hypothetical protein
LIFLVFLTNGQDYPDRIITQDGDVIECCITLVNAKNIYYYHLKRDIRRPATIAVDNVMDYTWTQSCKPSQRDNDRKARPPRKSKKWGYGVKLAQQFNYPVMHTIAAFNVRKGNHNLFFGPHYTHISKEKVSSDTELSFSQSTYGLNFGYMIVIRTRNEIFDVFMQMDFSLYEATQWYTNGPYSNVRSEDKLVTENHISVGLKYNAGERFELHGGYGVGATDGFFLQMEDLIPHVFVALQYNIR